MITDIHIHGVIDIKKTREKIESDAVGDYEIVTIKFVTKQGDAYIHAYLTNDEEV